MDHALSRCPSLEAIHLLSSDQKHYDDDILADCRVVFPSLRRLRVDYEVHQNIITAILVCSTMPAVVELDISLAEWMGVDVAMRLHRRESPVYDLSDMID